MVKKWFIALDKKTNHRAMEHQLPYGITVLAASWHRWTCPTLTPDRPVLDLPTPEGWKAELTFVVGYIIRWFTYAQSHPSK